MTANQIVFGLLGLALLVGVIFGVLWKWREIKRRPPQVHSAKKPQVQYDKDAIARSTSTTYDGLT